MAMVTRPETYRCGNCHKVLARPGKRAALVGLGQGCTLLQQAGQAAQIRCSCGKVTIFLKAGGS